MNDDPTAGLQSRSCPTCHGLGDNPACADPWHQPQPGVFHRIDHGPDQSSDADAPDAGAIRQADWVDRTRAQGGLPKLAERTDALEDAVDEAARVVAQPVADLLARVADLEQAVASITGGAPTGDWHTQTLRAVILHRARKLIDATDIPVIGVDVVSMFLDTGAEGMNPAPVLVIWAHGVAATGPDSTLLSWHALPGWTPADHDTVGQAGPTPGLVSIVRKMAGQLRQGRANQLRTSAPGVINHRATTHWG